MMDRPRRYANVEYWNQYADWLEAENEKLRELPYITDEMFEEFGDTCLMTWRKETNRPHWTQTAVDFMAALE
jgi:hypothetical protein